VLQKQLAAIIAFACTLTLTVLYCTSGRENEDERIRKREERENEEMNEEEEKMNTDMQKRTQKRTRKRTRKRTWKNTMEENDGRENVGKKKKVSQNSFFHNNPKPSEARAAYPSHDARGLHDAS
jgi:hypothetical protein